MSLLARLTEDLKTAMKSGDVARREVIKLVKADIQQTVMAGKIRREATDSDALASVRRLMTVKTEIADNCRKANRVQDAENALVDFVTLEGFLPKQMTDEEIRAFAEGIIAEKGLEKHLKSIGPVLKELLARHEGEYDPASSSAIVRSMMV